jgi:hypothetical protein
MLARVCGALEQNGRVVVGWGSEGGWVCAWGVVVRRDGYGMGSLLLIVPVRDFGLAVKIARLLWYE